jgi:hypothetical protein
MALACATAPAFADEVLERYRVTGGQLAGPVELGVTRWTTAAERSELLDVLRQNDTQLTLEALEQQKVTGYVELSSSERFDLHYAIQFKSGTGRRLILVADRPIRRQDEAGAGDVARDGMTIIGAGQQGMTIVDFTVDEDGEGSGVAVIGAEASVDAATGAVQIITGARPPIQLQFERLE